MPNPVCRTRMYFVVMPRCERVYNKKSTTISLNVGTIIRQRLRERSFICNRIVFDAVTPSVYTTPIGTVAGTGSI